MKHIWAPWRLEYVIKAKTRNTDDGCPFCEIFKTPPAYENLVLAASNNWRVVLNRFPFTNGHLLLVPHAHVPDIEHLGAETLASLGAAMAAVKKAIAACYEPQGFNYGCNIGRAAGAGIPEHVHFHVVPRWNGDTNFMPVMSEVRCINDHLHSMYDQLLPHLKKFFKEDL